MISIDNNPYNLQKGFTEFTDIRFKKTTGIIMTARSFASSLFNRDEDFCNKRDENSKRTDYSTLAKSIARGWAQHLPFTV